MRSSACGKRRFTAPRPRYRIDLSSPWEKEPMSDTLTGHAGDVASNIPDYPMARAAGCPLAPAPVALELNAVKSHSRVRIWDGSTPWLITGYDAIRSLFADSRASVDDKPGYPHWNEGMLATVHKRPRSVFTADAEEHTTFRRMLSKPFTFKRVEGLRPAVQKVTDDHIDAILAGPQPADLVDALALPVPSPVPGAHFDAGVEKSRLSIPHVSKELICKYLTDLKLIGALEK
jgi:cytochrome P450